MAALEYCVLGYHNQGMVFFCCTNVNGLSKAAVLLVQHVHACGENNMHPRPESPPLQAARPSPFLWLPDILNPRDRGDEQDADC